ncbi:protoporphyrinogen oxidase [Nocardioides speluncae]|uniref:protoporphyrinogen oxidase n=1 Tax=Nocardioides speluncae TaxID=2670337 RepID=UPI000D69DB3D|nr:protoporphyrinogen oxidase [Nocardioides speluncae]
MTRVVVVGAGIAGLTVAHDLARDPDLDVLVLEGAPRVGGKLLTAEVGGVSVDVGAEAMLARRPEGVALARELGLPVVHPATTSSRLWLGGELRPLPRSVLGVPVDLDQLAASGVLTPAGLNRVRAEPSLPPTELAGDVSVAELVGSRLGAEVVDRLVEPLLGGVYAGHARALSARATVPQVVSMLDRGSLVEAAAALPVTDTPVFAGIEGGVGRLPLALAEGLTVRTGATVRELRRRAEGGFELVVGSAAAPELIAADRVVLATPAAPTARLLADLAPTAAAELAAVEYASMAIVTLAFRAADAALLGTDVSGFLVPPVEGRTIKASTFSFAKWDWVRAAGGDVAVLRTSLGRHREEAVLQAADDELVTASLADLKAATGLAATPVASQVQRWGGGLPQYAVGHLDKVARIRTAIAEVPGLAVCGAAYDGVGIPAVIASAHRAAAEVGQAE